MDAAERAKLEAEIAEARKINEKNQEQLKIQQEMQKRIEKENAILRQLEIKLLPLVKEANMIAEGLSRNIIFRIKHIKRFDPFL